MASYGGICRKRLLARSKKGDKVSKKLLLQMVRKNRDTEIGRKYHFRDIRTVKDYQRIVPLTTFKDYEEYVERTAGMGEQGLMTADRIVYFADTSGTVSQMKKIPVTKAYFPPTLHSGCILYWLLRKEMKRKGFGGRNAIGLNLIENASWPTESGIHHGYITSYMLKTAKPLISKLVCFPPELFVPNENVDARYIKALFALAQRDLSFIWAIFMSVITDMMAYIEDNHRMLIRDIAKGRIDPSIKMPEDFRRRIEKKLRPDPKRARELAEAFRHPERGPIVPRIWRKMSLVMAIGTGEFFPYVQKMRGYMGPDIAICHQAYASSESVFATCINENDERYLLIPYGGFFEFLPLDEEGEGDVSHPLTMKDLRAGEHYELVLTNLSGLYRYRIRDVVYVNGFQGETPFLQFAYRQQQMINILGTHVTTEQLRAVVKRLEDRLGIRVEDYTVYEDVDCVPARIVCFMEPAEGEDWSRDVVSRIPPLFDELLVEANLDFRHNMEENNISATCIKVLPKGTFRGYREEQLRNGKSMNQLKAVRVIQKPEQLQFFSNASESSLGNEDTQ